MYLRPEPLSIRRSVVKVADGREVHFRHAGEGPPIVLLHQSPTSSAELTPLVEFMASDFTVIAPDTPGFGQSDPLPPGPPNLGRYANALKMLTDALGLDKFGVYGFHTGAMIASEFSRRFPDSCTAAVIDGYVVMDPEPVADILENYFIYPELTWDGGHMAWLWARMRDQGIFFPWYDVQPKTLFAGALRPAAETHMRLLDYLRTDLSDSTAYKSAFLYDSRQHAKEFTAPTTFINYRTDAIAAQADTLTEKSSAVVRELYDTPEEVQARTKEIFKDAAPGAGAFSLNLHGAVASQRRFFKTSAGNVHGNVTGQGAPILLLHDAGQSQRAMAPIAEALESGREVIRLDLPGHGETGALQGEDYAPESIAAILGEALDAHGVGACDIVGAGAGGTVALALAKARGAGRVVVIDPWLFEGDEKDERRERLAPPFEPDTYGAHLVSAWYQARDREFFSPWYKAENAAAVQRDEPYDIEWAQARAVDLLLAQDATRKLIETALDADLKKLISGVDAPLTFVALQAGAAEARAEAAAGLAGNGATARAPYPATAQGEAIAALLG